MRMSRINVYVPDDLAAEARSAKLNISAVVQDALRRELNRQRTNEWLEGLRRLPRVNVTHDEAMEALDKAKEELWGRV